MWRKCGRTYTDGQVFGDVFLGYRRKWRAKKHECRLLVLTSAQSTVASCHAVRRQRLDKHGRRAFDGVAAAKYVDSDTRVRRLSDEIHCKLTGRWRRR